MKLIKMLLVASALLMAGTSMADDRAKRLTYNNPILPTDNADPTVMKADDGYFYFYSSGSDRNVKIYRSRNLVDWIFVGTAFTDATRPRTVSPYVSYKNDDGTISSPGDLGARHTICEWAVCALLCNRHG